MLLRSLAVQVGHRPLIPYAMMLVAVFFYATLPVGLVMLAAAERPLLSVGLWELGSSLVMLLMVLVFARRAVLLLSFWRVFLRGVLDWRAGLVCFGTLHVFFFTFALGRVDPLVATVLFHLSSSIYVVVLAGSSGAAGPRRRIPRASWVLVLGCFAASALAVFSERDPGVWHGLSFSWSLTVGYGLCLLTALGGGLLAFVVPWAFRVSRQVRAAASAVVAPGLMMLLGFGVLKLLWGLLFLALGIATGDAPDASAANLAGWGWSVAMFLLGAAGYGLGNILWFISLSLSTNSLLPVIDYLEPALSLFLLLALGLTTLWRLDLLLLAVLLLIACNVGVFYCYHRYSVLR